MQASASTFVSTQVGPVINQLPMQSPHPSFTNQSFLHQVLPCQTINWDNFRNRPQQRPAELNAHDQERLRRYLKFVPTREAQVIEEREVKHEELRIKNRQIRTRSEDRRSAAIEEDTPGE